MRAFPESGAPRADFGADLRIAVVHPYVVFYDFVPSDDVVTVWRILHVEVSVDEKLLRDC